MCCRTFILCNFHIYNALSVRFFFFFRGFHKKIVNESDCFPKRNAIFGEIFEKNNPDICEGGLVDNQDFRGYPPEIKEPG